ncbi:hypothetical protein ACIP10_03245 [Streptomyces galbus]|uniref:hypothetical protein n=1 Tax=Streptomyces galbus TaxID=33898 RepID=UPI001FFB364A|nr:hypothetical protein [Streptomyces galbus]
MSTGVIIALIVVAVVVAAVLVAMWVRGPRGAHSLKQRFGPEYDRAVARHGGDTKAAEQELTALVERHGNLQRRPLEPAERERYEARWTAVQERFVDSPREAVVEADRLVAELAGARGYPDGAQYEEQLAALSVHHAHHVNGYRTVHGVAHSRTAGTATGDGSGPGTEDMRTALIEARALFEDLLGSGRDRAPAVRDTSRGKDRSGRQPFAVRRHQAH